MGTVEFDGPTKVLVKMEMLGHLRSNDSETQYTPAQNSCLRLKLIIGPASIAFYGRLPLFRKYLRPFLKRLLCSLFKIRNEEEHYFVDGLTEM